MIGPQAYETEYLTGQTLTVVAMSFEEASRVAEAERQSRHIGPLVRLERIGDAVVSGKAAKYKGQD